MQLIKNTFCSPYFIFIKEGFKITDQELLQRLDLKGYELVTDKEVKQSELEGKWTLFLTEDSQWTHLMDNWFYTLWHDTKLRNRIKNLSADFDIFYCYGGDCDESLGFVYYQNGALVREYIVEDPNFRGSKVVRDFGAPFTIEKTVSEETNPFFRVLSIAKSIGIDIQHRLEDIRPYRKLKEVPETFIFEESEF
ncbi:MAG: hypothetical protein AB8B69_07485 [Chitinophagales bacterium]